MHVDTGTRERIQAIQTAQMWAQVRVQMRAQMGAQMGAQMRASGVLRSWASGLGVLRSWACVPWLLEICHVTSASVPMVHCTPVYRGFSAEPFIP